MPLYIQTFVHVSVSSVNQFLVKECERSIIIGNLGACKHNNLRSKQMGTSATSPPNDGCCSLLLCCRNTC